MSSCLENQLALYGEGAVKTHFYRPQDIEAD